MKTTIALKLISTTLIHEKALLTQKLKYIFVLIIVWLILSVVYTSNSNGLNTKVKSAPLSARAWLSLADNYYNQNNKPALAKAKKTLKIAEQISQNRSDLLYSVWERQIRWGHFRDSRSSAKRLMTISSKYNSKIYNTLIFIIGTKQFVKKIIPTPKNSEDIGVVLSTMFKDVPKNQYIDHFLKVWAYLPKKYKILFLSHPRTLGFYQGLTYINYNSIRRIATSDNQHTTINDEYNSKISFHDNNERDPFCWIKRLHSLSQSKETERYIQIQLGAIKNNSSPHQMICYLPISVNRPQSLTLSTIWSAQNLNKDTNTKIIIKVFNKNKKIKNKTIKKQGSWEEETITESFTIGSETEGLGIYIQPPVPNVFSPMPSILTINSFNVSVTNAYQQQ